MPDRQTRALLSEALEFFNNHPRVSLRRQRGRTSYDLASRIEAHLAIWDKPPHPAIAVARERWGSTDLLHVDEDERVLERKPDGYWVRGWIHVGFSSIGEIDATLGGRYEKALADLPIMARAVLLAHQHDNLSYSQIATRFGLSVAEVRTHVADALLAIGRAMERD